MIPLTPMSHVPLPPVAVYLFIFELNCLWTVNEINHAILPPGLGTIPLRFSVTGPTASAILFRISLTGVVIDVAAHRVVAHVLLVEVVHIFHCSGACSVPTGHGKRNKSSRIREDEEGTPKKSERKNGKGKSVNRSLINFTLQQRVASSSSSSSSGGSTSDIIVRCVYSVAVVSCFLFRMKRKQLWKDYYLWQLFYDFITVVIIFARSLMARTHGPAPVSRLSSLSCSKSSAMCTGRPTTNGSSIINKFPNILLSQQTYQFPQAGAWEERRGGEKVC